MALDLVMVVIAILIFVFGLVFFVHAKKHPQKVNGKYPKGHYIGLGMALGAGFGVAINSIPIGVALGAAFGIAWEKKAEKEGKVRSMTKKEVEHQKKAILVTVVLTLIVVGIGLFFMLR